MNRPKPKAEPPGLSRVEEIVAEAGALAVSFFENRQSRVVASKSPGDYVSDADRAVERLLHNRLSASFPDRPVVGEEFGGPRASAYWSVDPIDGTSNFLSGLPFWAISVGLVEDGAPVAGVVAAPALDLVASGSVRDGFRLSGLGSGSQPARAACFAVGRNGDWAASDRQALEAGVEAAGYNVIGLGSCALSLLLVAAGRLAGYAEHRVSGIWDCAGGLALCQAAGQPAAMTLNADGTVDVRAGAAPGPGLPG